MPAYNAAKAGVASLIPIHIKLRMTKESYCGILRSLTTAAVLNWRAVLGKAQWGQSIGSPQPDSLGANLPEGLARCQTEF